MNPGRKWLILILMGIFLAIMYGYSEARAEVVMIGMQSTGGGEYVIWHPDGTVSLYVVQIEGESQKLVKIKDLDIRDYPLNKYVNPIDEGLKRLLGTKSSY